MDPNSNDRRHIQERCEEPRGLSLWKKKAEILAGHHGLWDPSSKQAPGKASRVISQGLYCCQCFDWEPLISRTLMEKLSVIVNHQICGKLLGQPRDVSELEYWGANKNPAHAWQNKGPKGLVMDGAKPPWAHEVSSHTWLWSRWPWLWTPGLKFA